MKILALDSTAQVASVCLCDGEKLLCEFTSDNGNTHSETLLPMVQTALKVAGLAVGDIDLFAVSQGPGSFTGVRIGVATLKGLAFGQNKNCLGVSTLEALAENMKDFDGVICPVMNARRDQVYTALFTAEKGALTRETADSALSLTELADLLKDRKNIYFVGDGVDLVENLIPHKTTPYRLQKQSAYSVAQVARKEAENGKIGTDVALKATYLRLPQAERERNERLQKEKEQNKG